MIAVSSRHLTSPGVLPLLILCAFFVVSWGSVEAGDVTVTCTNCEKEVPESSASGEKCPHCGILWLVDSPAPAQTAPGSAEGSGGMSREGAATSEDPFGTDRGRMDPFGAAGERTIDEAGGGAQAEAHGPGRERPANEPRAPRRLEVPPVPPAASEVQQEMTLSTMPLWMKAAFFFGAIGAGYYMLFYR